MLRVILMVIFNPFHTHQDNLSVAKMTSTSSVMDSLSSLFELSIVVATTHWIYNQMKIVVMYLLK